MDCICLTMTHVLQNILAVLVLDWTDASEVKAWIHNYIPLFYRDLIIYACPKLFISFYYHTPVWLIESQVIPMTLQGLIIYMLNSFEELWIFIDIFIILQHWNVVGCWNPLASQIRTFQFHTYNIMVDDDLVMAVSKTSAAMTLTQVALNNLGPIWNT